MIETALFLVFGVAAIFGVVYLSKTSVSTPEGFGWKTSRDFFTGMIPLVLGIVGLFALVIVQAIQESW